MLAQSQPAVEPSRKPDDAVSQLAETARASADSLIGRSIEKLEALGLPDILARWSTGLLAMLLILGFAILLHFIARKLILRLIHRVVKKTHLSWDDALIESNTFRWLVHWVPAILVYQISLSLGESEISGAMFILRLLSQIYMIVVGLLALDSLLNAIEAVLSRTRVGKEMPLTGFIQVVKLLFYLTGLLLLIATLTNQQPLEILAGLGVMASILMLVFKDAILGFVAGIQLAANRMVAPGDWIEMPKFGADGDVLNVGLTTVKVQNFDKTITTIPTYALIQDSFKNWRGMQQSGGRRIKRALHIDMNTVRICTPEMLKRFEKIEYIGEHIANKQAEVKEWNSRRKVDPDIQVNGRQLTNLGTFRAYVEAYLRNHPQIHQEGMTLLVRQLAPTEAGLPIEIYCFCKDTRWAHYEDIQSDIFDHLIAVAQEFDLRIYQSPAGSDFQSLRNPLAP